MLKRTILNVGGTNINRSTDLKKDQEKEEDYRNSQIIQEKNGFPFYSNASKLHSDKQLYYTMMYNVTFGNY